MSGALTQPPDAGYANLVRLLQRENDTIATMDRTTLFGAVSHYISSLPDQFLSFFMRTIMASPSLWGNRAAFGQQLECLAATCRSSVSLKAHHAAETFKYDIFSRRSTGTALKTWLLAIGDGLFGVDVDVHIRTPLLLAFLQGIGDCGDFPLERSRRRFEDELAICCAELSEWTPPVGQSASEGEMGKAMSLRLLSQAIPMLPPRKTAILDLEDIATSALDALLDSEDRGTFLVSMDSSLTSSADGRIDMEVDSQLAKTLDHIRHDPTFALAPTVSKLVACCITNLAESPLTRIQGWRLMEATAVALRGTAQTVESGWASGLLADLESEQRLLPTAQKYATAVWAIFKTMLFSSVLIGQSILDATSFYARPQQSPALKPPSFLASSILEVFMSLSFVSSKMGSGVAAFGGGFTEQKRAFFTAIDIVAVDKAGLDCLILRLGQLVIVSPLASSMVQNSRVAFFLACAEQSMPALDEESIEQAVLPIAIPLLSDPSNTEKYESAHSVLLSIFASHAKQESSRTSSDPGGENGLPRKAQLAHRLAPFYLQCLLDNVQEDRLSEDQLCLAYSSLVSSATFLDPALAQLCVDRLVSALDQTNMITHGSLAHTKETSVNVRRRLQRTLVSLISAVKAQLLPDLLDHVMTQVSAEGDREQRARLSAAIFKEIMEKVADAEREIAMKWWMDARGLLTATKETERDTKVQASNVE